MVRILKKRRTYCKNKCKKHTIHKVSQYKKGAESPHVQGIKFASPCRKKKIR